MDDRLKLLVDGDYVESSDGAVSLSVSPVTGETVAEVSSATLEDAERAVFAAAAAFENWSQTSFVERRRVLLAAADVLEARAAETAETMALETGATAGWSAMNSVEAAATLREAAGLTSTSLGDILPSHDSGSTNLSVRVPAGVVLAIVPWNAPLVLAARSIAVALATGNSVILRPSEESPNSAGHLLASALVTAGIPKGVVSVLTTAPGNGRDLIHALIANPKVRRVVFIGSTPVGRKIAQSAGDSLTPAVMELGGKNPTIVLDDADLDRAIPQLVQGAFANSGQVCMATDRIIASDKIFDELTGRLLEAIGSLKVGDPREASTDLGPLINRSAAENFRSLITDAEQSGATRLFGSVEGSGLYASPVVLTGLSASARLYHAEAFSPLVSVQRAANEQDAIDQANDTDYGLIASVMSADPGHAWSVANRVHAGAVHVNGSSVGDEPHVPFGGIGLSGFGRLGGQESVRAFTEQRTLYLHGIALAQSMLP